MGVNSLPTVESIFNVRTLLTQKALINWTLTELIWQTVRELARISQKLNKLPESPKPRFPFAADVTWLFSLLYMYVCMCVYEIAAPWPYMQFIYPSSVPHHIAKLYT